MIVVLDTNVIVSALLSPSGPPARIIQCWEERDFDVAISTQLLSELEHTLNYSKVTRYLKLTQEEISTFLKQLMMFTVMVEPDSKLDVIKKDASDNRVLECAVCGNASYIVSGDEHLLELEEYRGIVILSPAGFLTLLELEGKRKKG